MTGSGTSWTAAEAPLPANAAASGGAFLGSVACPSASTCVAGGFYTDSSGNEQGLLITGSGTSWTAAEAPLPANAAADPDAGLDSETCPSASTCVAAGTYEDSSGNEQGLLITGSGTSWTAAEAPLPANAAAKQDACEHGGVPVSVHLRRGLVSHEDSSGQEVVLVTGSGTSWTAAEAPLPANAAASGGATLDSETCPSASSCVAACFYADSSGNWRGLLVTGSG